MSGGLSGAGAEGAGSISTSFPRPVRHVRLHVNVDHVATLRQARGTRYPDPVTAASLCELAGADGITVHLREDRRHIQDRDVRILRETVQTILNLEMAATDEMVRFALEVKPDVVTLVPERREERTTEGGLDAAGQGRTLGPRISALRDAGFRVSLFVAPEPAQVRASAELSAAMVELHTGEYCGAAGGAGEHAPRHHQLGRLRSAAMAAAEAGLEVAAGHGLSVWNVGPVSAIPDVRELNIGHAIVSQAALVGMERAVREMIEAIARGVAGGGGGG